MIATATAATTTTTTTSTRTRTSTSTRTRERRNKTATTKVTPTTTTPTTKVRPIPINASPNHKRVTASATGAASSRSRRAWAASLSPAGRRKPSAGASTSTNTNVHHRSARVADSNKNNSNKNNSNNQNEAKEVAGTTGEEEKLTETSGTGNDKNNTNNNNSSNTTSNMGNIHLGPNRGRRSKSKRRRPVSEVSHGTNITASSTPGTAATAAGTKPSTTSTSTSANNDICTTKDSNTSSTVAELQAQLEAMQSQLRQAKVENDHKDKLIHSLRHQMLIEASASSTPTSQVAATPVPEGGGGGGTGTLPPIPTPPGLPPPPPPPPPPGQTLSSSNRSTFSAASAGSNVSGGSNSNLSPDIPRPCTPPSLIPPTAPKSPRSLLATLSSPTNNFLLEERLTNYLKLRMEEKQEKRMQKKMHHSHDGVISNDRQKSISSLDAEMDIVNAIQRWLFLEGGELNDMESLMREYSRYCRGFEVGIPLDRFFVCMMMVHHPKKSERLSAKTWTWQAGTSGRDFSECEVPSEAFERPVYNPNEPFSVLLEGKAKEYRWQAFSSSPRTSSIRRNRAPPGCPWIERDRYQDYFSLPMYHKGEFKGAVAWSTKRSGGFTNSQIQIFSRSLKALSAVFRLHTSDLVMSSLIRTMKQEVAYQTRELATANKGLAEANQRIIRQSQNQLKHFAMMSHEIRTPLNCIVGLSNLLLDSELDPQVEESIEMITSSGDLLLAVVDDVLDYSKLATGKVETIIQQTNLRKTMSAVVASIRTKAKLTGLELRTVLGETLPEKIETDGRRLQQILYNLLGNAVKFGGRGEYIEFTVELKQDGQHGEEEVHAPVPAHHHHHPSQSLPPPQEYIQFSIKDYGKGIAPDEMRKIFEPFQQAATNEPSHGGTGLGLAITRQLVRVLGGVISVESEFGKWCEFTVKLPLKLNGADDAIKPVTSTTTMEQQQPAAAAVAGDGTTSDTVAAPAPTPATAKTQLPAAMAKPSDDGDDDDDNEGKTDNKGNKSKIRKHGSGGSSSTSLPADHASSLEGLSRLRHASMSTGGSLAFTTSDDGDNDGSSWGDSDSDDDDDSDDDSYTTFTSVTNSVMSVSVSVITPESSAIVEGKTAASLAGISFLSKSQHDVQSEEKQEEEDVPSGQSSGSGRGPTRSTDTTKKPSSSSSLFPLSPPNSSSKPSRTPSVAVAAASTAMPTLPNVTSVPNRPAAPSISSVPSCVLTESFEKVKVLIAEDNAINQKVLHRTLNRIGLKNVDIVDDGQKAVDANSKTEYDIIFMDLQMPVMDGLEATKIISTRRRELNHTHPKVVFLTAHALSDYQAKAADAGGDGFISKPFKMDLIKELLLELQLGSAKAEDSFQNLDFVHERPTN